MSEKKVVGATLGALGCPALVIPETYQSVARRVWLLDDQSTWRILFEPDHTRRGFWPVIRGLRTRRVQSVESDLGHEDVLTTVRSYGAVGTRRQGEIIRDLANPHPISRTDASEIAKAVVREFAAQTGSARFGGD
jgi:hypothetical protein